MTRLLLGSVLVLGMGCSLLPRWIQPLGPPPEPVPAQRPSLAPGEIAITWLGAAGALVRGRTTTVAFDPYVSRNDTPVALWAGNLREDSAAIQRYLPHVDLVLIGHAHPDHVLDAPYLVRRDKAQLVGSLTTVNLARSYGVPIEQLHAMGGGDTLTVAGTSVSATRVDHIELPGVKKPAHGVVHEVKPSPWRASSFKDGGALMWRVVVDGIRIGHLSSPAAPRHWPQNLDVDVLLLSMAGPKPGPAADVFVEHTHPTFVVPIHWDFFFLPLHWDPATRLTRIRRDVQRAAYKAAGKAQVVLTDPMQERILNIKTQTWR